MITELLKEELELRSYYCDLKGFFFGRKCGKVLNLIKSDSPLIVFFCLALHNEYLFSNLVTVI